MIRWFKGRKQKRKCYDSSGDESPSEYGFKDTKSEDPYGFRKPDSCVQVADVVPKEDIARGNHDLTGSTTGLHGSSSPHIYDEIKDLPDHIIASQFRILTGLKFPSSHTDEDEEGPYMVVPVLPARNIPGKSSAMKKPPDNGHSHKSQFSSSKELDEKSESVEYATNLIFPKMRENVSKTPTYESVDLLNCSKSDTESIALPTRVHRTNDTESESDNDLNSTDGTTESEYPVFLDKIEQNLFLKQQVREIIQSLSRPESVCSNQSRCNRTESFSTVSTESSADSSVPPSSASEISDPDVFADQSESEDEDSKIDITAEETEKPCVSLENSQSKPDNDDSDLKKCVQKQRKRAPKLRKSKIKTYCLKDKDHETKLQSVIQEDTEMYLLPSCKQETDYYNFKTCRKPVLIPTLPTRIYQDPNRLKSNKNNKLLGDLIRMNYDKQHLILV